MDGVINRVGLWKSNLSLYVSAYSLGLPYNQYTCIGCSEKHRMCDMDDYCKGMTFRWRV